eukprot:SAG31_NODE_747_length_12395_cov_129.196405_7_plen_103_part_00
MSSDSCWCRLSARFVLVAHILPTLNKETSTQTSLVCHPKQHKGQTWACAAPAKSGETDGPIGFAHEHFDFVVGVEEERATSAEVVWVAGEEGGGASVGGDPP